MRITLRPATVADAGILFEWRNRAESLEASLRTTQPVSWDQHVAWLDTRLCDPKTLLFIADEGSHSVGQVRLQDEGEGPEVSIFVAPERRRHGIARDMLRAVILSAATRWPHSAVLARIKPHNKASQRLFEDVGFRIVRRAEDHLVLEYDLEGLHG